MTPLLGVLLAPAGLLVEIEIAAVIADEAVVQEGADEAEAVVRVVEVTVADAEAQAEVTAVRGIRNPATLHAQFQKSAMKIADLFVRNSMKEVTRKSSLPPDEL